MKPAIRAERPGDEAAIRALVAAAFADVPYSDDSEPEIVEALRAGGDLAISLVAEATDDIVGHVAFSPVVIDGVEGGWFGLGPVSVLPGRQRQGIGTRLIDAGIAELRARGALGVVVVGDPSYYARFGFERDPRLIYPHPGGEYLQRLSLSGEGARGIVRYAPAFG
ncbi:GNAT family N-acetyltransferase [Tsuneonella sp. SYSU-LHT278]|uniref:GNAT family N-acetyltransferase n=1 Tax=Tsuneonella sediminis TaxID=3416089 RepID=UPI003F797787